jgi:uncharacterized protein YndB with AHSA1/START domain
MNENIVTTPADKPVILIERMFDAPRTIVWRCYTEPKHLARFWGPRDANTTTKLDLKVGGVWVTRWAYDNGGSYGYTSVYLEIAPIERIVYRDAPDGWPGGFENLPPVTLHSTLTLSDVGNRTRINVTVLCRSIAERDVNVQRGFALMVGTGNDRLEDYLKTLDPAQA